MGNKSEIRPEVWINLPYVVKRGYPGGFARYGQQLVSYRNEPGGFTRLKTVYSSVKIRFK